MKILIDNGHGIDTKGKCSPDGSHKEWEWTRMFSEKLKERLEEKGYTVKLIVPEEKDISLKMRVSRVNNEWNRSSDKHILLISIHNNAAGKGDKWNKARGFSSFVGLNASEKSKRLADCIARAISSEGVTVRKPKPDQWYWQQDLAMCRDTYCPAVLTENLFQDNKDDVMLLGSDDCIAHLIEGHVRGIDEYVKMLKD